MVSQNKYNVLKDDVSNSESKERAVRTTLPPHKQNLPGTKLFLICSFMTFSMS
jgi:hypothetical protein